MSSSEAPEYKALKKIPAEKRVFLKDYCMERIALCQKSFEGAETVEDMKKLQGQIHELRHLVAWITFSGS